MAVDDNGDTYWASKFDDTSSPVEFVVDFGDAQKLHSIELSWEFPARSFAIASSVDGVHFTDVYATDANVLKTSRVPLGDVVARKLRISMTEVCSLTPNDWSSCWIPCALVFVWRCVNCCGLSVVPWCLCFHVDVRDCMQPHPTYAR